MWIELLSKLQDVNLLEAIATLSFVIYVILATRQHPLCWPVSMVGVGVMCYISFQARLYADILLNVFYFFISIYGLYNWVKGGNDKNELPVSKSSPKLIILLLAITICGIAVMGFLLDRYTDTDVAYWDASTTVMSFVGTWMLAQKKIGNWVVWIIVDAIYIWLYYYKNLPLLSVLNVFYVIISFYGLYSWNRSMIKELQQA